MFSPIRHLLQRYLDYYLFQFLHNSVKGKEFPFLGSLQKEPKASLRFKDYTELSKWIKALVKLYLVHWKLCQLARKIVYFSSVEETDKWYKGE